MNTKRATQLVAVAFMIMITLVGCSGSKKDKNAKEYLSAGQAVRDFYIAQWNGDVDQAWKMMHFAWREVTYANNFARYSNEVLRDAAIWKDNPRSILRIKAFPGDFLPFRSSNLIKTALSNRKDYDFAVVRVIIDYPEVKDHPGRTADMLITTAKKKKQGEPWKIFSISSYEGALEHFQW